ncbi:MAG: CmcI family methyltransferase [Sneathiellaceae bacterium]
MKLEIDTDAKTLRVDGKALDLYGREAYDLVADLWMKTSWNQKYSYTFTWMGRPIIQHPEDMIRTAEVIYQLRPDVIIETGIAHGGSLIYYASLFKAMGHDGRVVGVDIEIRPHNRAALEAHELKPLITLIEGDSAAKEIVDRAAEAIRPGDTVMVILDSNHSRDHVAKELEAYHHLVTPGSYIVATDGLMEVLHDVPRGQPGWKDDNPAAAARAFVERHPDFAIVQPTWAFNESDLDTNLTGWPDAWLQRKG